MNKNKILVLLPKGIVYGERNLLYARQVINYKEVAEIRGRGAALKVYIQVRINFFGKRWGRIKQVLDLSWLQSPKEGARRIREAYTDFKANGYVQDL